MSADPWNLHENSDTYANNTKQWYKEYTVWQESLARRKFGELTLFEPLAKKVWQKKFGKSIDLPIGQVVI